MNIDNIADYGYNWLSKELSDKVTNILAILQLWPTSMAFSIPIMVKKTECGNYVVTLEFMAGGTGGCLCTQDVMISTDSIINMAKFKPDAVNEYFTVMQEALNYSDMLRNKHKYNKVFGTEMPLCKQN